MTGTRSKVLILGGDGFCGWPTALHLSNLGFEITIVDNFSRRDIDTELGTCSLTPISSMNERLKTWRELTGKTIEFVELDVARNYDGLLKLLKDKQPDTVVHFAEQRSAPYSMKNSRNKRFTVSNNLNATHNLLAATVDAQLDSHIVHLGSMGVYGYSTAGIKIPEGYLQVKVRGEREESISKEILYPADPESIYHMTKAQDQLLFQFYNKNNGVRVTDLHQGIVWGTQTLETRMDVRLINRFDYDGDFGTVLNRFLMQAAIKHPLTVHGSGGQTRAFINIQDTVRCIEAAVKNPPVQGERVRIVNQMTEVYKIIELAQKIAQYTGAEIEHVPSPRSEPEQNQLIVENNQVLEYGLELITLDDGLVYEVKEIAEKFAHRCDRTKIPALSQWNPDKFERSKSAFLAAPDHKGSDSQFSEFSKL